MLKKEPRQARSRWMVENILEAATRVLDRAPLAAVTTNHIADVAGVSVGSLYQYFDSKEAIAICLLERHRRQLVEQVRNFGDRRRGYGLERLVLDSVVDLVHERRSAPTYYLNLLAVKNSRAQSTADRHHQIELAEAIASILRAECPGATHEASMLTARLIVSGVSILIQEAIRPPVRERDDAVTERLAVLIPAYIRTLSGRPAGRRRASAA